MDWTEALVYAMIVLLAVGTPALFIGIYCRAKARRKWEMAAMPESDDLPEPELVSARVVATHVHRFWTGSRKMKVFNEEFQVTFQLESGEEIVCCVPKETYYAISEGDCGMLLHVSGNFLDFGEGKECDTTM